MTDPIARPAKLPRWASDPDVGLPGAIEPSEGKKDDGWTNGEAPAAGNVNWLLKDHAHWLRYLDGGSRVEINALANAVDVSPSGSNQIEAFAVNPSTGTVVAVGAVGTIKRTTDWGKTWTAPAADAAYTGTFRCALYGGGKFVIAGTAGAIQVSTDDGLTWASHAAGSSTWAALAYDGATYVISGFFAPAVRTSTDAITWTAQTIGALTPAALTYHAGTFVLGDTSDVRWSMYTSTDSGVTWIEHSLGEIAIPLSVWDVTYSPALGLFVAACFTANVDIFDSFVITSPDGVTWSTLLHIDDTPLEALAARSTASACYIVRNGAGFRVFDGGDGDITAGARLYLSPAVRSNPSRVALLESATPRASAFFFADQTTPGDIYRSQIWSPPP